MHMDTNGILLGAIAGDVIGSYYEHFRTKNYNFELFKNRSKTILSLIIAGVMVLLCVLVLWGGLLTHWKKP